MSGSKLSAQQTFAKDTFRFRITDLCCPTCAVIVEKALAKLPGVHLVSVSYFLDTAFVEYDPSLISIDDIQTTVQRHGFFCIQRH